MIEIRCAKEQKQLVRELRKRGTLSGATLGMYLGICDIATDLIESLSAELTQVTRERDAAVRDIELMDESRHRCYLCKHGGTDGSSCGNHAECISPGTVVNCYRYTKFQYGGVCAENGGDERNATP